MCPFSALGVALVVGGRGTPFRRTQLVFEAGDAASEAFEFGGPLFTFPLEVFEIVGADKDKGGATVAGYQDAVVLAFDSIRKLREMRLGFREGESVAHAHSIGQYIDQSRPLSPHRADRHVGVRVGAERLSASYRKSPVGSGCR